MQNLVFYYFLNAGEELWEAKWGPDPNAGLQPFTIIDKPIKGGIKPAQPQASKQAYVPPNARGKLESGKYRPSRKPTGLHDEDELPENLKGKKNDAENLSKSAAKNKKRREAAAKKKMEESTAQSSEAQSEAEAVNNTAKSTGDPEKDKKIRKINEKLTQIHKLKEQAKAGKQLEANQLDKIKKEAEFLAELKMLKL